MINSLIVGIFVGVILTLLIHNNIHYHGPDSSIIRKQILVHEGKKYILRPVPCICPLSFYEK